MADPNSECIKSIELYDPFCFTHEDWEKIRAYIEDRFVQSHYQGCHLALRINDSGNLPIECVGDWACVRPTEKCCMRVGQPDGGNVCVQCECVDAGPGSQEHQPKIGASLKPKQLRRDAGCTVVCRS